ncbi:MAG: type III restriction endonuclease [Halobacteriovorax sp.]|nr:type III restriction endonuclease [Halobacteriovorax sp.]|tara:strand:- start:340460 stop:343105 length:2646 start_codon:yes stop_codon:yes gene_type:complete
MVKNHKERDKGQGLDFTFYKLLRKFYLENKGAIKRNYRDLTKKYLDYNDPAGPNSFLRVPQYEALEMYVFLKEYLDNEPVQNIFKDWYEKNKKFKDRSITGAESGQATLFGGELDEKSYKKIFSAMKKNNRMYSNYIFALTMGTGKTILMATCIFYEFILAKKWPKDIKYCHNALVFAPDKTVLHSLKEIQTFDMSKVVPPEYVNFLTTHIQFHFLEEAGTSLSTLDKSMFNIVISNSQKIILKKKHKEKSSVDKIFESTKDVYEKNTVYSNNEDLYGFDVPDNEVELATNQRFEKLRRLEQLGIYVDEAHHVFGAGLAKDMGVKKGANSLRTTIDELALSLAASGTRVVSCYNYTGTPYVGKDILPEVVYGYGLKEAIDNGYLKKVQLNGYTNVKNTEFIKLAINDFVENYSNQKYEGMLPKLAIFASSIEELVNEVKPAVEDELTKLGIPLDRILVNVGDDKVTSNDDIRRFVTLDTRTSSDQFILLVNKGREGWNCRSLFGVALYRSPRSKIFVLQATMRCLRSIGEGQQKGRVYLSNENLDTLNNELQQNFRINAKDLQGVAESKDNVEVRPVPPPVKITLKRKLLQFELLKKEISNGIDLELDKINFEKYRVIQTTQEGLEEGGVSGDAPNITNDLTSIKEKMEFSPITIVAEISRYLNRKCLEIDSVLENSKQGMNEIVKVVNDFNEVLYDWIIPRLFNEFYELNSFDDWEEHDVELVKDPPLETGYYTVRAKTDMTVSLNHKDLVPGLVEKSFHLDTYCFDSKPERTLFWDLLKEDKVKKVYFTGMLTHGQSDFFIQYIDPEQHSVRSYYPDFIFEESDGSYVIVEVKGDNMVDDPVVQAKKEYASQMAVAAGMRYEMIKGSEVENREYRKLFK